MNLVKSTAPWSWSWLLKRCCSGSQNKWAAPSAGADVDGCDAGRLAAEYSGTLRQQAGGESKQRWSEKQDYWGVKKDSKSFMFVSPGKKKSRLSTVRAIDWSLTTSMDWPMSTVLGMLPSVPLTYSATSWTVNICSSSSKMSGKLFNSAAYGGRDGDTQRNNLQHTNMKKCLYGHSNNDT